MTFIVPQRELAAVRQLTNEYEYTMAGLSLPGCYQTVAANPVHPRQGIKSTAL